MRNSNNFDELLERRKKGSLKIYLGYAAGVGKTYTMLQEAHRLKKLGHDVVIGYLELHDRPETMALLGDLEIIPKKRVFWANTIQEEMDLEGIERRNPQIVLIDELAHTNAPGLKHTKRYEDVLELLDKQIHVITTLNVQHLESIADKFGHTGIEIRERLPDYMLARADQIVNVDITIEDLRERLRQGKVYKPAQAERALQKFFTPENLSLLREVVLKEVASEQFRRNQENLLLKNTLVHLSHDSVMVALSSDPTNAGVLIRKGTKMAAQLSCPCYVVYVQRKHEGATQIDSELQRKLQKHLALAKNLGAEVVTLQGESIAEILCHFAEEKNIRHAVFGQSRLSPLRERLQGSVLLDFIHDSVGVDVHIVCTVE